MSTPAGGAGPAPLEREPMDIAPLERVEDDRLEVASDGAAVDPAWLEFVEGCEHTMPDGSNVFDKGLPWSNDGSNALREAAYMRCETPALKQARATQLHVLTHHA